jgi:hypothetical protein
MEKKNRISKAKFERPIINNFDNLSSIGSAAIQHRRALANFLNVMNQIRLHLVYFIRSLLWTPMMMLLMLGHRKKKKTRLRRRKKR